MRHHRQATIIVDFMYELYHLYDEVALTKEEEKVPKKINTMPRKNHPSTTKNLNPPKYSLPELLTVQQSILPYNSPDWNGILSDKKSAQGFKYPAGGKILVQKGNNRWLRLPSKANIYPRQGKQVKINTKNITLSYAKKQNNVRGNTKQDLKQIRL